MKQSLTAATVPHDTIPYIKHSSYDRPLDVSFLESHQLTFRNEQTIERQENTVVTYKFIQDTDFKIFQEDLRNMDLLGSFDCVRIAAGHQSRLAESANNEVLTLWRSREAIPVFTLCFYAGSVHRRYVELPISWFQRDLDRDSDRNSVRLHFNDHGELNTEHRWTRFKRRVSLTRRLSPGGGCPPSPQSHL
jgi:hypothetical protein